MTIIHRLALLLLLPGLAACGMSGGGDAPETSGPETIVWQGAGDRPAGAPVGAIAPGRAIPLRFTGLVFDIRRGTAIGGHRFSLFCAPPYSEITWTGGRGLSTQIKDVVHDSLSDRGFDMVGDPARLFEVEEDEARAEYLLRGRVTLLRLELCNSTNWLTGWPEGTTGEAEVRVDWAVYSRMHRQLVMQATTGGHAVLKRASFDGEAVLIDQAIGDATDKLALMPAFHTVMSRDAPSRSLGGDGLVARDGDTAATWDGAGGGWADANPVGANDTPDADPDPGPIRRNRTLLNQPRPDPPGPEADPFGLPPEPGVPWLELPATPPFTGPMAERIARIQAAVVLVAAGAGHGSGVFIDPDGLLLTNYHVVGNAERVRVVLADGVALVGRVERVHKGRDVALVRVPPGRYDHLSVVTAVPPVSTEVYALGAPLRERFQGTLTRGIVGSLRRDSGSGEPLIQADVSIQGGNSGGPLLDASGNVLGIAVSAVVSDGVSLGLNFFIPIASALERLHIRPAPPAAAPPAS